MVGLSLNVFCLFVRLRNLTLYFSYIKIILTLLLYCLKICKNTRTYRNNINIILNI